MKKEHIFDTLCGQWPCGCKPWSSLSSDYCPEHQLKLGSLEQRIIATVKYLNRLTDDLAFKHNLDDELEF